MTNEQKQAIDAALHTHCEDTFIVLHDGTRRAVAYMDPAERRAHVPEALALAQLHRAFVDDTLNAEYQATMRVVVERMAIYFR